MGSNDAPDAAYDTVLLVETTPPADAERVLDDEPVVRRLLTYLRAEATDTLVFSASNVRRIAPVDHRRQGVFLFNYFSAKDVESNLFAWQYTAGWFQDQTGLDNSTVLRPLGGDSAYTLVNHCRWERMRDVLPSLVFKRSFRDFVLRVFDDNGVAPRPILYRLHPADDR